jgi:chemotaxis signal transduction protein
MPAGARAPSRDAACGRIGPIGASARVVVGTALLALAAFWREPHWSDAALGLIALPGLITMVLGLRARVGATPLRATGPDVDDVGNMVLAAVRRAGGCEVTAISNVLLRRDDQIGCAPFGPIDLIEANAGDTRRAR